MLEKLMVLSSVDPARIRVVRVPMAMEEHVAYRSATALVAGVEESIPGYSIDDIMEVLEDNGFEPVDFIQGPVLD